MCGQSCCDFTGVTNPKCWLDDAGNPQQCPVGNTCVDDFNNPNFNCNGTTWWERQKWKCCDQGLAFPICTQLGSDQHCSNCSACPAGKKCVSNGKGGFQCVCSTSSKWALAWGLWSAGLCV